jgi:di/tricarboxylate transporter
MAHHLIKMFHFSPNHALISYIIISLLYSGFRSSQVSQLTALTVVVVAAKPTRP